MRMNKTLSVEQWAADIVEASITISRVIVPVGWRTESGKGGGEINEQTRDRAEKLANTRNHPLPTTLSFLREQNVEGLCPNSEFFVLGTWWKALCQSLNPRRTLELTERRCLFPRQRFPKSPPWRRRDSTKDSWLTVPNRWIV